MKNLLKNAKLKADSIQTKILNQVNTHPRGKSNSEIRIIPENHFPEESFLSSQAADSAITILQSIVNEIRKLPKAYHVQAKFTTSLIPFKKLPN